MKKYYDILEAPEGASPEELKKCYRKRAFSTHPDRNNGDDSQFKLVQEAYETLTGKRRSSQPPPDFNPFQNIQDFMNQMNQQAAGRWRRQRPPSREENINFEFNLSVDEIKKGKKIKVKYFQSKDCNPCKGEGGSGRITCPRCNGSGNTVHENRQMGFVMQATVVCSHCNGDGKYFEKVCEECKGQGWHSEEKTMIVEVKGR